MSAWISAHDFLRTDWLEADPRNKLRPDEAPASIRCGLDARAGRGQCRERFFTELGRDLHHEEDHGVVPVAERV